MKTLLDVILFRGDWKNKSIIYRPPLFQLELGVLFWVIVSIVIIVAIVTII